MSRKSETNITLSDKRRVYISHTNHASYLKQRVRQTCMSRISLFTGLDGYIYWAFRKNREKKEYIQERGGKILYIKE